MEEGTKTPENINISVGESLVGSRLVHGNAVSGEPGGHKTLPYGKLSDSAELIL